MHDGAPPRDRPGGPAGSPAPGTAAADPQGADMQRLARDWITLWQSELTAAAADRELQETWQTLAGLWAGVAGAVLAALPRGLPDGPTRHAAAPGPGAAAPARSAPPAAAPDPRDAEIQRLARSVAELERRLADLERAPGSG
jgi:hypothetical protein